MKNALSTVVFLLLAATLVSGCREKEAKQQGGGAATETIAPAAAKPLPTENEAMTQTVDVEGGSEGEGGGVTSPETPASTASGTVGTTTAPATGAAAVAKGRNAPGVPRNRTQ